MSSILLDPTRVSVLIWTNDLPRSQEFFGAMGMKSFAYGLDHVLYGVDGLSLLVYKTSQEMGFNEFWACLPHVSCKDQNTDSAPQSTIITVRNLQKVVSRLSQAGFRLQQAEPFTYGDGFQAVQVKDQHGRNFFLIE